MDKSTPLLTKGFAAPALSFSWGTTQTGIKAPRDSASGQATGVQLIIAVLIG